MDASKASHPRPTIVFVPGAFHTSAHFEPISTLLNQESFPTTTSYDCSSKTASYRDDVYAIRSVLEKLVEGDGKEVTLALHSYGGVPGCQTVSRLERSKRKLEGKPGGIVHILFIAALLVEQGHGMAAALEGGKAPSWAVFKNGLLYPVNTLSVFYSDLPPMEAEHWNSLLVPKSASKTSVDVADVCYDLDVPITYLLCTDEPYARYARGNGGKGEEARLEGREDRWRAFTLCGEEEGITWDLGEVFRVLTRKNVAALLLMPFTNSLTSTTWLGQ